MQRTPVSSSSIQSVGFDSETEILEIEWPRGAVYRYWRRVGEKLEPSLRDHYAALASSENPDSYFNQNLRKHPAIDYRRLSTSEAALKPGAAALLLALGFLALSPKSPASGPPACYSARVQVTLPAEAFGKNLFANLYSINGEGRKVHVVSILTQGQPSIEYAIAWSGTWEIDLTLPDGEIVASQIAIPSDGCWSATNAPLFAQVLSD